MTTTLEQAVSQIQQELLAIRAQLASRVHEDTPNPIDVNSQGCPNQFSGKGEDFQQCSRELQTFLAGEIKESEMMLEWAADQMTEITTNAIVPGTRRVAFHWFFDSINLDPKIQIKYVDTKNQLADILTKGNFTRDEWNSLLHLFNISSSKLP